LNLTKLLAVIALVAVMALAMACGDDDADSTASPTDAGTPRPTAPLNLPADFPEDFPLYDNMSLDQGARFENQVLAAFFTPAEPGEVAAYYRAELAQEPWEIVTDKVNALGDVITLTFRHSSSEVRGTLTLSEPAAGAGTAVNTSFVVPQEASPLDTAQPTPTNAATPTADGEGAG
jgi:hypothetical protein